MQDAIFVVWVAMMSTIIAYLVVVTLVTARLRSRHEETWDKLGRFSLIANNSIGNGRAMVRYVVFSSAYRELNDDTLSRLALAMRILFWLSAVLFLSVLLMALSTHLHE